MTTKTNNLHLLVPQLCFNALTSATW